MKAADHFTENTKKEALVLHLYEIDSLGLINRPREHIYQNQCENHRDVEFEIPH